MVNKSIFLVLVFLAPAPVELFAQGNLKYRAGRHGMVSGWYDQSKNVTPKDLENGRKIYQKSCAGCHGPKGKGDGPDGAKLKPKPSDLTKIAKMYPNQHFYMQVRLGGGKMPSWQDKFIRNEIMQITAYIRSLAKK